MCPEMAEFQNINTIFYFDLDPLCWVVVGILPKTVVISGLIMLSNKLKIIFDYNLILKNDLPKFNRFLSTWAWPFIMLFGFTMDTWPN